jgi:hypothetical protein
MYDFFKIGNKYKIKERLYFKTELNDDFVPVLGEFRILQIIKDSWGWGRWIAEKDGQVFLLHALEVDGYWNGIKYEADLIDTDALCRLGQKLKEKNDE